MVDFATTSTLRVYPVSAYSFGSREAAADAPAGAKDRSAAAHVGRLRAQFPSRGTRRTAEAVLVVHQHRHPHVLLLQHNAAGSAAFVLPGGKMRPGEDDAAGLVRKVRGRGERRAHPTPDAAPERHR